MKSSAIEVKAKATTTVQTIHAVTHVRRMRGGAQAHLMRCTNNQYYVTKFTNNPQHIKVLANELIATKLAEQIGLPVPPCEVIEVSECLTYATEELCIELGSHKEMCTPGQCFGSQYVANPEQGTWQAMDYLPDDQYAHIQNVNDFVGILCLDKWTCNSDGRQAVFVSKPHQNNYKATFIDFGYCFNAGEWNYPDAPLRGVFSRNIVYWSVKGWHSFEPWLTRIQNISESVLWEIASSIPHEWYGHDQNALVQLIEELYRRRKLVPDLIVSFAKSSRNPFPNWTSL